ncbi:MAG: hypothetical protein JTT11_03085 [Candidatus Brockarchaeota archaeon]|nr:hypothetical protein [Candidatus Brockarchaeota archaeon]
MAEACGGCAALAKPVEAEVERCGRCRSRIAKGFRFCPSCGSPLGRPISGIRSPISEPILILEEAESEPQDNEAIFV